MTPHGLQIAALTVTKLFVKLEIYLADAETKNIL